MTSAPGEPGTSASTRVRPSHQRTDVCVVSASPSFDDLPTEPSHRTADVNLPHRCEREQSSLLRLRCSKAACHQPNLPDAGRMPRPSSALQAASTWAARPSPRYGCHDEPPRAAPCPHPPLARSAPERHEVSPRVDRMRRPGPRRDRIGSQLPRKAQRVQRNASAHTNSSSGRCCHRPRLEAIVMETTLEEARSDRTSCDTEVRTRRRSTCSARCTEPTHRPSPK